MKKLLFTFFLVLGLALAGNGVAQALIIFTLGNNPQSDEENILLNTGTSGNTVFGTTNITNRSVTFTSTTDTLSEPSQGQAEIQGVDGSIQNLKIFLTGGGTFKDLIINPECPPGSGSCGSVLVTVQAANSTFTYNLGNGQNFLTITATGGDSITSVTLDATGFEDLNQPRISGVAGPGVPIPEPTTILLIGLGLIGLGAVRRIK